MDDSAVQNLLKELQKKAKESGALEVSHARQADAARAERQAYEFAHDKLLACTGALITTPLALPKEETE